ncbi:MAG: zinc-binding dehydrogenase [Dehalococcoidia bacterium]
MKAARISAPRTIDFLDIPQPTPSDGECLIKLEQLSVCGSDIRLEYDADLPEEEYPMAPGKPCHECAGVVVESRTPEYNEGDRVIVIPREVAGMVEYTVQSPDRMIRLPEWGGLDEWVMCQHSGTVLYSAKKWGNPVSKRIAVLGQGGIGLTFTMLAEKQGALQVIGLDLHDYRLDKARELGATHTVNPTKEDPVEAVQDLTDGKGLDIVVDASGAPEGLENCVRLVNRGGVIISFSLITPMTASFSHRDWMAKNVTIHSTVIAATNEPVKEIREIVALRDRGWIDPGLLKTHNWGWNQIPEAFEMYANRSDGVIKVALKV